MNAHIKQNLQDEVQRKRNSQLKLKVDRKSQLIPTSKM